MKVQTLLVAVAALALAACTQTPKAVAPAPAPVVAEAPPPPPPPVQAAPPVEAMAIATAERNLRALGYPAGKSIEPHDPALRHAILAFEKDQGLAEDGQLSPALEERLGQLHAAMLKKNATQNKRSAIFVYSDGATRNAGLSILPPVPAGLASDALPNLLQPMRPGSQASYHLGHRAQNGSLEPTSTVSCRVGHIATANTVFGAADVLPVDCHVDGGGQDWHSLYSPMLDAVVKQDGGGKSRVLVAIRPSTANWPLAARTGLDWALTHALETPSSDVPLQWSSTAVAQHFEVRAFGKISGQEMGLAGKLAASSCRRFELDDDGHPPSRYPGVACQKQNTAWTLAGTGITLASPAKVVGARNTTPGLRSAQNQ
jgi:uncharacterized protein YfiM (DUF2279 family)